MHFFTKTKSHPLLDGSSFERKEREKFGYMSSTPVTAGNCYFYVFRESVACFPLTVNRIPQLCVETMCKLEKDHKNYKHFEKKKVRKTTFSVFTSVHRSAIVIFVINILQNAK